MDKKNNIKSFKELIVWQKSMDLVLMIYRITNLFPQNEIYGISNQMRRAVVAVPYNIAEGFSRQSTKEYKQFLNVAYASICELETQIEISYKLSYLDKTNFEKIIELVQEVGKMLNKLIKVLNNKIFITNY